MPDKQTRNTIKEGKNRPAPVPARGNRILTGNDTDTVGSPPENISGLQQVNAPQVIVTIRQVAQPSGETCLLYYTTGSIPGQCPSVD